MKKVFFNQFREVIFGFLFFLILTVMSKNQKKSQKYFPLGNFNMLIYIKIHL